MSDVYSDLVEKAHSGDMKAQKELAYHCLSETNRKKWTYVNKAFTWFRSLADNDDSEALYIISFFISMESEKGPIALSLSNGMPKPT